MAFSNKRRSLTKSFHPEKKYDKRSNMDRTESIENIVAVGVKSRPSGRSLSLQIQNDFPQILAFKSPKNNRALSTVDKDMDFTMMQELREFYDRRTDLNEKEYETELYSDKSILKRESLRFCDQIQHCLRYIWKAMVVNEVDGTIRKTIQKEDYIELNKRLFLMLGGNTEEDPEEIAAEDWDADSEGRGYLDYNGFAKAMFQLCDTWTTTISENEYIEFLTKICETIVDPKTRTFFSLEYIRRNAVFVQRTLQDCEEIQAIAALLGKDIESFTIEELRSIMSLSNKQSPSWSMSEDLAHLLEIDFRSLGDVETTRLVVAYLDQRIEKFDTLDEGKRKNFMKESLVWHNKLNKAKRWLKTQRSHGAKPIDRKNTTRNRTTARLPPMQTHLETRNKDRQKSNSSDHTPSIASSSSITPVSPVKVLATNGSRSEEICSTRNKKNENSRSTTPRFQGASENASDHEFIWQHEEYIESEQSSKYAGEKSTRMISAYKVNSEVKSPEKRKSRQVPHTLEQSVDDGVASVTKHTKEKLPSYSPVKHSRPESAPAHHCGQGHSVSGDGVLNKRASMQRTVPNLTPVKFATRNLGFTAPDTDLHGKVMAKGHKLPPSEFFSKVATRDDNYHIDFGTTSHSTSAQANLLYLLSKPSSKTSLTRSEVVQAFHLAYS